MESTTPEANVSSSADTGSRSDLDVPRITKEDLDAAVSRVNFDVDEFDGSWTFWNKPDDVEARKQATGPKESRYVMLIDLWITRESATSDVEAKSLITLMSTECMEMYQWDTKSDIATINLTIERDLYVCEEETGYAVRVFKEEIGRYLSIAEMERYCNVLSGSNIKYRVLGNSGIVSSSGPLPQKVSRAHKDMCTIFFGLKQGLEAEVPTN